MSWPEKAEALVLLAQWQALHEQTAGLMEGVFTVFGDTSESLLFETVWKLFDAYTDALAARIGDSGAPRGENWLDWFCHENAMGAKRYGAGYNGVWKPVVTLEDLHALIEEGRDEI